MPCSRGAAISFACVILAFFQTGLAAASPSFGCSSQDKTQDYFQAQTIRPDEALIRELQQLRVLLVPGYISRPFITVKGHEFGIPSLLGSFHDQMQWMRKNAIPYQFVEIQGEQSALYNSKPIIRAIEDSDRPVLILSHSKGGLDTLEALLERKDLQSKVRGWIAMQSPFFGSPATHRVTEHVAVKIPFYAALSLLGGSKESLLDLSLERRKPFMKQHADEIQELVRRIRVISLAAHIERSGSKRDSYFNQTRDYIARFGLQNDGLVPVKSAVLPGSDFVELAGVDHLAPALETRFVPFDRVETFTKLLRLLLSPGDGACSSN